jgi:integrase
MLTVMPLVQLAEDPGEFAARAELWRRALQQANLKQAHGDEEILVHRRALETLVSRFIGEARAGGYQLTRDTEFWPTWIGFCNFTAAIEDSAASLPTPTGSNRAPPARLSDTTSLAAALGDWPGVADPVDCSPGPGPRQQDSPDMQPPREQDGNQLRLSEAAALYLAQCASRDGDGRAGEDFGIVIKFVIDLCGDLFLNQLGPSQFMLIENSLPDIPHPKGVPAAHRSSLHRRLLYAQAVGWDGLRRIGKKRIQNHYHRCLHQFFAWAQQKGLYGGADYRFRLVDRRNSAPSKRDAWTRKELLKLFALPLFTGCRSGTQYWRPGDRLVQNDLYWAYLLIFFMGLRPSEIGRTLLADLVQIEGRWYVDYRNKSPDASDGVKTVKRKASARLIPIPQLLIDLGLLDRRNDVAAAGGEMLFPEWHVYVNGKSGREMWGHQFSKSFQYIRARYGFERQDLTLYGGRHTKATWLDTAGIARRIRLRVLGHEPTDVADEYGAKFITPQEAEVVLAAQDPVEVEIGDLLLTAKLLADYGKLTIIKTWTQAHRSRSLKGNG